MNRFHRELIRDRFDELFEYIYSVGDILEKGCPAGTEFHVSDGLHNAAIRVLEAIGLDNETFKRCVVPEIERRASEHRSSVKSRARTIGIFEKSAAADAFEAVERERLERRIEAQREETAKRIEVLKTDLARLQRLEGV